MFLFSNIFISHWFYACICVVGCTFDNNARGLPTDFGFLNTGKVFKNDTFVLVEISSIYNEGYQYKDSSIGSSSYKIDGSLAYLFLNNSNELIAPPSGMRSSVSIGPIGQGTFEIRGDGRFSDFSIFGNGVNAEPNIYGQKIDLNEMYFGLTISNQDKSNQITRIFQTHPLDSAIKNIERNIIVDNANTTVTAIDELNYYGAFPIARLSGCDNSDGINGLNKEFEINLTAIHSFTPFNVYLSSIPSVAFIFDFNNINNSINNNPSTIDLFFNFEDRFGISRNGNDIQFNSTNGELTFNILNPNISNVLVNGNITIRSLLCTNLIKCKPIAGNYKYTPNANVAKNSDSDSDRMLPKYGNLSYIMSNMSISDLLNDKNNSIIVLFSWYFPNRFWNDESNIFGQYYNNFYSSSKEVSDDFYSQWDQIVTNIYKWNQLFWDANINGKRRDINIFPDYLIDSLMNNAAFLGRTALYTQDKRWRQFESWSCSQIEPPSIHGYRSFGYNCLFGSFLDLNVIDLYANNQEPNGVISESFGGGCSSTGIIKSCLFLVLFVVFKKYTINKEKS